MSELIEIVLVALACPLALPLVIGEDGDTDDALENAPTIEPERTGHWIKVRVPAYDGGYLTEWECDRCHEHQIIPQKFCGGCGAKMEVEHE